MEVEAKVKAQEVQEAKVNALEVEWESWMEDWEALEAKMVPVEAIDEAQEAQEVQEDLVELVELEVQDHHSRRLPPDLAAPADQEHRHQVGEHPLSRLGRPHH